MVSVTAEAGLDFNHGLHLKFFAEDAHDPLFFDNPAAQGIRGLPAGNTDNLVSEIISIWARICNMFILHNKLWLCPRMVPAIDMVERF
jgi:hypothetical protein